MICYSHTLKHKKDFDLASTWKWEFLELGNGLFIRLCKNRESLIAARVAQLVSARPSVREVPISIRGDIISLFQILSFLCSFD